MPSGATVSWPHCVTTYELKKGLPRSATTFA